MYRIEANLENRFGTLWNALTAFSADKEIRPWIPETRADREDAQRPRICVAPTIQECFTAIGLLGRFRRTLSANDGAYSYATDGHEAYPIILLAFDNEGLYTPSEAEVEDVGRTREHWFLAPKKPKKVELRWLDMFSVRWLSEETPEICKSVKFLSSTEGYDHPWLNGKGHILESSRCEDEPMDEIAPWHRWD